MSVNQADSESRQSYRPEGYTVIHLRLSPEAEADTMMDELARMRRWQGTLADLESVLEVQEYLDARGHGDRTDDLEACIRPRCPVTRRGIGDRTAEQYAHIQHRKSNRTRESSNRTALTKRERLALFYGGVLPDMSQPRKLTRAERACIKALKQASVTAKVKRIGDLVLV